VQGHIYASSTVICAATENQCIGNATDTPRVMTCGEHCHVTDRSLPVETASAAAAATGAGVVKRRV